MGGSLSRNQTAESGLVSYLVEPPSSGALGVLGRLGEGTSLQSYLCSTCLRVPVRAGRGGGGGGGDPARRHCGKGDSVGGFSSGSGRHGGGKEQGWGCSEWRGLVLGVGG